MEQYLNNIGQNTILRNSYALANSYDIKEGIDEIKEVKGVVLLIAPSNSGKTVLLIDMLNRIHKDYKIIRFFSRTMKLQPVYDFVPRSFIHDDYDEEALNDLWNIQIKNNEQGKPLDKVLIVLDDIIASPSYKKSKLLDEIAVSGRHLNFTLILLSQNFTSIKPIVRNNAFMAIAFALASRKEREKFVEAFLAAESNKSGDILFRKITEERYQSIVINVWKVGCKLDEKVKKYTADPDVKIKLKEPKPEPIKNLKIEGMIEQPMRLIIKKKKY